MKIRWTLPALLAAMWGFAAWAYSRLPARIPIHWDLNGRANGFGGRVSAFLLPAIATALPLLILRVLPRMDPRRAHWARFADEAQLIVSMIVIFLGWTEVVSLGVAMGWKIDVSRFILTGVGLMFAAIGNYLPRLRSNWWMGIRTPWTLSSERVWRETHRVGGRAFVAGGLVCAATAALLRPPLSPVVPFLVLAFPAAVPVVYSWFAWKRERAGGLDPEPRSGQ